MAKILDFMDGLVLRRLITNKVTKYPAEQKFHYIQILVAFAD